MHLQFLTYGKEIPEGDFIIFCQIDGLKEFSDFWWFKLKSKCYKGYLKQTIGGKLQEIETHFKFIGIKAIVFVIIEKRKSLGDFLHLCRRKVRRCRL